MLIFLKKVKSDLHTYIFLRFEFVLCSFHIYVGKVNEHTPENLTFIKNISITRQNCNTNFSDIFPTLLRECIRIGLYHTTKFQEACTLRVYSYRRL